MSDNVLTVPESTWECKSLSIISNSDVNYININNVAIATVYNIHRITFTTNNC